MVVRTTSSNANETTTTSKSSFDQKEPWLVKKLRPWT